MSIADDLNAIPSPQEAEYRPKTEFDGVSGFIQTASFPANQAPDFTAILEQFGYDPAQVRIVGNVRTSRWQTYDERWLVAYRFHIAPATDTRVADLDTLVKQARKRHSDVKGGDGYWFVFQAGDQQLGKRSSGGSTEQIVDRYIESVEAAKAELKRLKRFGIAGMQISMPGDCIEGNQSQSGRNMWLTQETVTEQVRILRRLMFHTVESFAPLVPQLKLDVCNGNHDEAQRFQNTYPGDGWATEAAVAVSDAIKLNESAFGHVEVRVPDKWKGHMTVPVGDTIVTVAHGHQWKQSTRAFTWWADQAVNNQPPGAAQLLQSGHFHNWMVESTEHKTHVQSSTYDCGSDWFRETRGATARRGGVAYLLKAGEVSRMSVV